MAQKTNSNLNNTHINKNMMLSIVTLATKEIAGVIDIATTPIQSIKKAFSQNVAPHQSHEVHRRWHKHCHPIQSHIDTGDRCGCALFHR